jgi:hypothetical protein
MNLFKKAALASSLAASALTTAAPAMARDYYGYHHNGDSTGAAIAGGMVGLALGAIIASAASNHDHDRYRDRGWQYRDGYYWDREGHRYDRDGHSFDDSDYYARSGYRDGYYGDNYYRGY